MRLSTRRHGGRLAMILAVPALLLAFAGCAATGDAADPSSKAPASRDSWTLKYTQCLRDNGVKIEDLPSGAGFDPNLNLPQAPTEVIEKCTEQVGTQPPLSKEEKAKLDKESQQALLKIAKCYRENGVNVPDPVPGEALSVPSDTPKNVVEQCGGGMAPAPLVGQ
ncbi:hypothetical protein [Streptosporangium sp. NPDC087985]|uniref:hypothetical protein n=1 Tax=Streptosporangium sp. NPDC087985 TaxID=3366196 RepID=UPI0038296459